MECGTYEGWNDKLERKVLEEGRGIGNWNGEAAGLAGWMMD